MRSKLDKSDSSLGYFCQTSWTDLPSKEDVNLGQQVASGLKDNKRYSEVEP